jgi:hypothetical protein
MTETGGGLGEKDKQRTRYGESGERWSDRAETKVFENKECNKNIFKHTTFPKHLAQDIHTFREPCIHTPYLMYKCTHQEGITHTRNQPSQKCIRITKGKISCSSAYLDHIVQEVLDPGAQLGRHEKDGTGIQLKQIAQL